MLSKMGYQKGRGEKRPILILNLSIYLVTMSYLNTTTEPYSAGSESEK